ncbi:cypher isoform b [Holotrichia oblita]|uniref:Cypher isoform b n=1 Tax=Holotrichia oblita TaxID=644536 RepID=A0ACB9TME4_HOLOL|nr:cypher isoform b [Holotrichia oblita]
MPKSQKDCPYRKRHNQDDIESALEAISNGMSKKKASVMFKVPRPTLQFRLSNKFKKSSLGPDTYLTKEEEEVLVQWIIESYQKEFPRRKDDIQISVKDFLDKAPRPNPFPQNKPGDCCYRNFLRRHPVFAHRTTEVVTAASANISEDDIKKWFLQIEQYLQEKSYFDILQDPERVFNGDETNLQLCPKLGKVDAPKGATNVYEVDKGLAKFNVTVMFTFVASGETTSPMMVFPYKRLPQKIVESVPKHWGIGIGKNGWTKQETFYEYIENILHSYLQKKGVKFPILLVATGNPVVFTLTPPECYMEIRYGYGTSGNRVTGPVRVGDPLTLIIYMRSKYDGFDIIVNDCFAHNGATKKIQLIDEYGCPIDDKLISRFRGSWSESGVYETQVFAYMKTFRFTGSPALYIECDVRMCHGRCPTQPCHWRNIKTVKKRSIQQANATNTSLSENINLFQSLRVLQDGENEEERNSSNIYASIAMDSNNVCMKTGWFSALLALGVGTVCLLGGTLLVTCAKMKKTASDKIRNFTQFEGYMTHKGRIN